MNTEIKWKKSLSRNHYKNQDENQQKIFEEKICALQKLKCSLQDDFAKLFKNALFNRINAADEFPSKQTLKF